MNWLDRKGVSSPAKIVSAFCLFCLSGFFLVAGEGVASETPQPLHDAVSSGLPYFPVQPPDSPTGQTDKDSSGSIIGFLILLLILLFFWGLRSSGPSRCQICDLEFGSKGKWNVVIDGKNLVICSRCQRKLDNKRHSEKFNDFMSQVVSNRRGSTNPNDRRERVASDVKKEVWNRDGGKCVECGSREDLEYDHIIPVSKGGANTVRNVQLLCEKCNRSKSANIQ